MNFRRLLILPLVVVTLLTSIFVGTVLAVDMGEPVEYDLTFPVDGPHYFADTFWAGRSHGFHEGQDIMADKMTPVVAAADGVIRLVNWTSDPGMNPDRCCTLVLRHDDGWESWYIHLDNDTTGTDDGEGWGIKAFVVPGVRVTAGQHIAWVGDSGNAEDTAPHLHFELRDPSGTLVNPYKALVAAGGNDVGSGPRDPLVGGARVLENGVSGYDVRVLQETLEGLGYSVGTIDGYFGSQTEAAVRAFQRAFGIDDDGRVGRTTKTALAGLSYSDPTGEVLSVGSVGSEVREAQSLLAEAGFDPGPVDGVFGALTLAAVIEFQKDQNLWVDGLIGPRTMEVLAGLSDSDAPDEVLSVGSEGSEVLELQSLLAEAGFDPGPIDGVFGSLTHAAVVAFQEDQNLLVDGLVGPETMSILAGLSVSDATGEILSLGSEGSEVLEAQSLLAEAGFDPGPVDGVFGPLTHAAVVAFQKERDLWADGLVGPRTRAALGMT